MACTLVDVLSCVPIAKGNTLEFGPRDYLHQFMSLMSGLRGGRQKYLPLLITKVNDSLPPTHTDYLTPLPRTISAGSSTSTQSHSPYSPMHERESIDSGHASKSASAYVGSPSSNMTAPFYSEPSYPELQTAQPILSQAYTPAPGGQFAFSEHPASHDSDAYTRYCQ